MAPNEGQRSYYRGSPLKAAIARTSGQGPQASIVQRRLTLKDTMRYPMVSF